MIALWGWCTFAEITAELRSHWGNPMNSAWLSHGRNGPTYLLQKTRQSGSRISDQRWYTDSSTLWPIHLLDWKISPRPWMPPDPESILLLVSEIRLSLLIRLVRRLIRSSQSFKSRKELSFSNSFWNPNIQRKISSCGRMSIGLLDSLWSQIWSNNVYSSKFI